MTLPEALALCAAALLAAWLAWHEIYGVRR